MQQFTNVHYGITVYGKDLIALLQTPYSFRLRSGNMNTALLCRVQGQYVIRVVPGQRVLRIVHNVVYFPGNSWRRA
jgi:hypothetical protein